MTRHDHAVDVVGGLALTNEHAVGDEPREAARALRVGFVGVGRAAFRQVDLGPRDVQEAPRPAGDERSRFLGVDDVVGRSDDLGRAGSRRPQCGERANELGHG